jgi:arsenite methyltransferase
VVSSPRLTERPDFGLDAPPIVYGYAALAVVGVVLLVAGGLLRHAVIVGWGLWAVVVGVVIGGLMVYSSKVGKIRVRDRLLDRLALVGDEDVLDLGCGSGLLLLGAAQRLPSGAATGVDLWRSRDQAGSNRELCLDNARRLGVQDRVTLIDGDMTELQMPDASFDLVLACLAIHNLHPKRRREQAVLEALRVLRPGGRFAFIDIAGTKSYRTVAGAAGCRDVRRSGFVLGIFPLARVVTGAVSPAVEGGSLVDGSLSPS